MSLTAKNNQQKQLQVVLAMEDEAEGQAMRAMLSAGNVELRLVDSIVAMEEAAREADIIVADVDFSHGALADWLMLWPLPALLVARPGDDPHRLAGLCSDEANMFIIRDPDGGWMRYVPVLLRKLMAIRESVNRQNIHVLRAEHSYMNLMRIIPDIVYVLDGAGHFAYINDAIRRLGFEPSELIGKHFSTIIHPDDRDEVSRRQVLQRFAGVATGPEGAPKLFDERRSGERMTRGLELRLLQKGGADYGRGSVSAWGEINANGVSLPEFGRESCGTIGVIHDVSARREAEVLLQHRLEAQSVMLKEIHHRVKNNLQIVSSLLSIQGDCLEDEAASVFEGCQTQVQAMALVHEQVYRGTSLQTVDAAAYLARLIEYLSVVYDTERRGIDFQIHAPNVSLPLDKAMPLSLVVSELISNACKHAFVGRDRGMVRVAITREADEYVVRIEDDGVGFPEGRLGAGPAEACTAVHSHAGVGMEIVNALATQLGASIHRSNDGGSLTLLRFPAEGAQPMAG